MSYYMPVPVSSSDFNRYLSAFIFREIKLNAGCDVMLLLCRHFLPNIQKLEPQFKEPVFEGIKCAASIIWFIYIYI